MAKKTKAATEAQAPATTTTDAPAKFPAAEVAEERGKNDVFVRVMKDGKAVEPAKRLPPQAQTIANAVEAAGKGGIQRQDLVKALDGKLVTRQPIGRIISYYQKRLQADGVVQIRNAATAEQTAKAA